MAAAFSFDVGTNGRVTGAIYRAPSPIKVTLVLAHGAGAPRTHPFMTGMAARIAKKGVDVVTFNFLYAEAGRKFPDRVELLEACWRAAIATVRARGGLPTERLFIGGKSMGGRIATRIAAENEGLVIAGVVLLGYPLHPMGKPGNVRNEILDVTSPMLVLQGTRDALGTADELTRFLRPIEGARVVAVEGGDHSFAIPRRLAPDGSADSEGTLDGMATAVVDFVAASGRRSRKSKGR